MKINKLNKQTIKYGFLNGSFFAIGMALFDYFGQNDFNIWKFIFNLVFFGLFMSLIFRPNSRNKLNKENSITVNKKTEMENHTENKKRNANNA
ncbi:hypothetical protein SAMN05444278_1353 [Psychroflexus salarius]|uniref:Uncharacterized protein n=1 Tax=Psychroflexus salarius TaxID=1155689 RepID=A0A1M4YIK7_9FLAO|nr:hypothetical protein [Psychroflexus salarius]SHF05531.1 hypothetical protein SAMN05444278_1353 [Psychroflexus salarius]